MENTSNNENHEKMPVEQIRMVLNRELVEPFIKSMTNDPIISIKVSNALVLMRISESILVEYDKNSISSGLHTEKIKEKNLYLGYLNKLFESSLYLLGATDYLGSIVLLRSVFELLIGISTDLNGKMKERIDSIDFLTDDENRKIYKLWRELSSWAHPYGKWLKNVCPRYYGIGRNYHLELFKQCLGYSDTILDFILTITVEHFKLAPAEYLDKYKEISQHIDLKEVSLLEMFLARLQKVS